MSLFCTDSRQLLWQLIGERKMNKFFERKLLHFFTTGSIYEDFSEARTKKIEKLRLVIRVCFYAHCLAAVLCIVLAAALHAGAGIIAVVLCELFLAGLAFLAVGDMMLMKLLLCGGDLLFTIIMFVTGANSNNGTPFYAVGAVSIAATLLAAATLAAAVCKAFLESFSPLSLRREHYTLLPNFSSEPADNEREKPIIVLPPKRTEMQELSDKLKEILCKPKEQSSALSSADTSREAARDIPEPLRQTEVL